MKIYKKNRITASKSRILCSTITSTNLNYLKCNLEYTKYLPESVVTQLNEFIGRVNFIGNFIEQNPDCTTFKILATYDAFGLYSTYPSITQRTIKNFLETYWKEKYDNRLIEYGTSFAHAMQSYMYVDRIRQYRDLVSGIINTINRNSAPIESNYTIRSDEEFNEFFEMWLGNDDTVDDSEIEMDVLQLWNNILIHDYDIDKIDKIIDALDTLNLANQVFDEMHENIDEYFEEYCSENGIET